MSAVVNKVRRTFYMDSVALMRISRAVSSFDGIETAALMLGSEKSRGYCLEMICADFLAGASVEGDDPELLLESISRYYRFLPKAQQETFLAGVTDQAQ